MAAELLSHTDIGGPIGAGSSVSGTGLIWGVYEVTSTENDDWIVLSEFDEIHFVDAKAVSSGVYTEEAVTVDETTTNKIVLHGGGTDTIRIFVVGTPAVSS
jgi:hypothetical protein